MYFSLLFILKKVLPRLIQQVRLFFLRMLAEMLTWWFLQQWTEFALWIVDEE